MSKKRTKKKEGFLQSSTSLLIAILVALALRTFVAEPYAIPSASMEPTLLIGDYLYVAKYPYGISRHSFLFGFPPFKGRIGGRLPEKGEVIVFQVDTDITNESVDKKYIKRVIGLPGDEVQVINGYVYVNGEKATQKRIEDYLRPQPSGRTKSYPQFIERLPNGKEHLIIRDDVKGLNLANNTQLYKVPEGYLFVMGDNRDNSGDSRQETSNLGFVPIDNLVGPAKFTWFSINPSMWYLWKIWKWPEIIRGSRIFKWIT